MSPKALKAHRHWVFDLDNTLYPSESNLFALIDARMTAYVSRLLQVDAAEAYRLQKLYYREHGTTLAGLIARHGVDPHDFLADVHEIDLARLSPAPRLGAAIDALPGDRLVFTNGSRRHAERVLKALEIDHLFDAIFAIEDAAFIPKPADAAFDRLLEVHQIRNDKTVMFEDLAKNLAPAHARGWSTVWVRGKTDWSGEASAPPHRPDHVHHETECLATFLETVLNP